MRQPWNQDAFEVVGGSADSPLVRLDPGAIPTHPTDGARRRAAAPGEVGLARLRRLEPGRALGTSMIVVSSALTASAAVSSRALTDVGLAPVSVAWFRFLIVALVLGPLLVRGALGADPARRRAIGWGLASGAVLAAGWAAYSHALANARVADVAVAYMTFPLFTLASIWIVFRTRPAPRQVIAGALVLVAAVIALGPTGGGVPVTALVAPLGFGFSIAVLTERLVVLDSLERLAAVAVGAVGGLLPVLVQRDLDEVVPTSIGTVGWIVAIGVGAALVPMVMFATAAPAIGGPLASVAGSVELPAMFAVGALVFGESITGPHVVGAALIGVAIVVSGRTRRRGPGRRGRRDVVAGPGMATAPVGLSSP